MEAFLKELRFPSPEPSYIKDITPEVNGAIERTRTEAGLVLINSTHTTLGLIAHEIAEPLLLEDIIRHSKDLVGEDPRSTWVARGLYKHHLRGYGHECMLSPLRPPDEIDEDFNAGRHLRALLYSHPSLGFPYRNGRMEVGRYQQVAIFEFDGRDGTGVNPLRERLVQIWIYPADRITILE